MPAVLDEAFCIRVWDWSETSQTVSLLCRTLGVVRGLAKGAKREDARFSGGFELFTRGQAGVILKSSDAMATLTSWDLAEVFPAPRSDLKSFHSAMAMLDVIHHMLRDQDPHPTLFDSLVRSARELRQSENACPVLLGFLWQVLSDTGFKPDLANDVRLAGPLDAEAILVFEPQRGGFTRASGNPGEEPWRVRRQTLDVLRRLDSNSLGAGESAQGVFRAASLLAAYVRETVGNRLPALETAIETLRV